MATSNSSCLCTDDCFTEGCYTGIELGLSSSLEELEDDDNDGQSDETIDANDVVYFSIHDLLLSLLSSTTPH